MTSVELLESATLGDEPPQLILALLQTGFATGTHELYQLPLGLRPAGSEVEGTIAESSEGVVYDALTDPALGRVLLRWIDDSAEYETARRQVHLPPRRRPHAARRRRRRPADGRRAVQLLAGHRRGAGLQGLPEAGAGHEPRARAARLSYRARVREHRAAVRLGRLRRAVAQGDARRRAALLPGRARRLGARARRARERSRRLHRPARDARRGDRAAAHRARLRRGRPGVLARGAEPGEPVAADRDGRRGHRPDLRRGCPRTTSTWSRSRAAARTCRSTWRCWPRSASAGG